MDTSTLDPKLFENGILRVTRKIRGERQTYPPGATLRVVREGGGYYRLDNGDMIQDCVAAMQVVFVHAAVPCAISYLEHMVVQSSRTHTVEDNGRLISFPGGIATSIHPERDPIVTALGLDQRHEKHWPAEVRAAAYRTRASVAALWAAEEEVVVEISDAEYSALQHAVFEAAVAEWQLYDTLAVH